MLLKQSLKQAKQAVTRQREELHGWGGDVSESGQLRLPGFQGAHDFDPNKCSPCIQNSSPQIETVFSKGDLSAKGGIYNYVQL